MQHNLLNELEGALHSGSKEKRVETLRRVTDLFLGSSDKLNEKQIDVFDDVLGHLIKNIETTALIELSSQLAPIDNAPLDLVRRLANDDEIAVAGPVLTQSKRLSSGDLVNIVKTKSQAHMLAISGRSHLEEAVTSALVENGDQHVLHKLSANAGARFSADGFSLLLHKADKNENLLEMLGLRADFPLKLLRDLLARASAALRSRLINVANPEHQSSIRNILARLTNEVGEQVAQQKSAAQLKVLELNTRGELKEATIVSFTKHGERDEIIAALALMNSSQFDVIERIVESSEREALLVPCMAARFNWHTVDAILHMQSAQPALSAVETERLYHAYAALTVPTAQRTLRFWQVRNSLAGKTSA